jgi:hypothetical protein
MQEHRDMEVHLEQQQQDMEHMGLGMEDMAQDMVAMAQGMVDMAPDMEVTGPRWEGTADIVDTADMEVAMELVACTRVLEWDTIPVVFIRNKGTPSSTLDHDKRLLCWSH